MDNIIELPVSHDCNQVDDNIVSKEDDDWYNYEWMEMPNK